MAEEIGGISTTFGVTLDADSFERVRQQFVDMIPEDEMSKASDSAGRQIADNIRKIGDSFVMVFEKVDENGESSLAKIRVATEELGKSAEEQSKVLSDGLTALAQNMDVFGTNSRNSALNMEELFAILDQLASQGFKGISVISDEVDNLDGSLGSVEGTIQNVDDAFSHVADTMAEVGDKIGNAMSDAESSVEETISTATNALSDAMSTIQGETTNITITMDVDGRLDEAEHFKREVQALIDDVNNNKIDLFKGVDLKEAFEKVKRILEGTGQYSEEVFKNMQTKIAECALMADESNKELEEKIKKRISWLTDYTDAFKWQDKYGLDSQNPNKGEGGFKLKLSKEELAQAVKDLPSAKDADSWKVYWDEVGKAVDKAKGKTDELGKASKENGASVREMLDNVKSIAMGYMGISTAKNFVMDSLKVRQDFELYEKKLEQLTGSAEKAKKIFGEIKDYGMETNLDFDAMNKATQTMLQYGVSQNEVIADMKMLGDIAMDDGAKLSSLATIFGKVTAEGELTKNTYKQLVSKGFDPLKILADETGESMDSLEKKLKKHEIGVNDLKHAMEVATSEGGQYYQAVANQTDTLKGAFDGLETSMQYLYDEIGQYLAEPAKNVINFMGQLIAHYKEIGKILLWVVGTYGAYKATMMVVTAIEKAQAAAIAINNAAKASGALITNKATVATILFRNAQLSLNATLMANPYALIVVAIAAIAYAIYKVCTAENEWDKAQKQANQNLAEFNDNVTKEQSEVDRLFGKLGALTKGTKEYDAVKQSIISKYGKYLDGLDAEKQKLDDISGAYQAITKAIRDKWKAQALAQAESNFINATESQQVSEIDAINERIYGDKISTNMYRNGRFYGQRSMNDTEKSALATRVQSMYSQYTMLLDKYSKQFDTDKNGEPAYEQVRKLVERDMKNMFENDLNLKHYSLTFDELNKSFDNYYETWKAQSIVRAKERIRYKNDWKEIDEETTTTTQEEEKEKEAEKARKKALEKLKKDHNDKIKAMDAYLKMLSDRDKRIRAIEESIDKSDATKNKEKAKVEEDFANNDAEFYKLSKDEKDALKAKYDEQYDFESMSIRDLHEKRGQLQKQLEENEKKAKDSKTASEFAKYTKDTDILKAQIANIDNLIDEKNKDFEKIAEKYALFVDKYSAIIAEVKENSNSFDVDSKKENEKLDKMLKEQERRKNGTLPTKEDEYSGLSDKKLDNAINEQRERVAKLEDEKNQILIQLQGQSKELMRQFSGVDDVSEEEILDIITSKVLEYQDYTMSALQQKINTLQEQYNKGAEGVQTAETAKALAKVKAELNAASIAMARLKKAEEEKKKDDSQEYWDKLAEHWQQYRDAISKCVQAMDKLGDAIGGSTGKVIKNLSSVFTTTLTLGDNIVKFGKMCSEMITKTASGTQKALKSIETASAILEIIALVFQLIDALKQLFSRRDAMAEFTDSLVDMRREMAQSRHELNNEPMRTEGDSIFGKDAWGTFVAESKIAQNALRDFNATEQRVIEDWHGLADAEDPMSQYVKRMLPQVKSVEEAVGNMYVKIQHKTWFRKEKGMRLKDAVPELFNENGELDYDMLKDFVAGGSSAFEQLSEENQHYLEDLSRQNEEYQEALQAMKDQMSSWFGSMGNDIVDIWADAFESGEDGLAEFENVWDKSMESMAKSMIYNLTIGKTFKDLEDEINELGFYENPEEKQRALLDLLNASKEKVLADQEEANAMMQAFHDELGLFDGNDATRSAITSGIANMSQDSAEEMNGRLTQIQSHTLNISEQIVAMREMSNQQLILLQGIKGDTARLEAIEANIYSLDTRIGDIQAYGLRLKD